MKQRTQIFGLLLLTALMLVKVSAFHIYSHQDFDTDAIEDCSYCDLAIENQNAELLVADIVVDFAKKTFFFETKKPQFAHQIELIGLKENLKLFLRPPPALS